MFKKIIFTVFVVMPIFSSAVALCLADGELFSRTELSLLDDGEVFVEVGEKYSDAGCIARRGTELLGFENIEYEILGEVDTDSVGSYEIMYRTEDGETVKTVSRTVHVVDTEPPVIKAPEKITAYEGTTEFSFKYSAVDAVDGDLTDSVVKTNNADSVLLSVSDNSGNTAEITVEVDFIKDNESPVIKLKGAERVFVGKGQSYKELGFFATDNCDGNITDKVAVSGSVDCDTVGSYTLKYSVADSSGNTVETMRTVTIYDSPKIEGAKSASIIYLTFDDGPGPYTDQLLGILDKYGIKASFFVTNQFPEYQKLIGKAHRLGHTIAVHTYSHRYENIYKSVDAYLADFYAMNDIIFKQTGEYSRIFRFPGGTSNMVSAKYRKGIMTELSSIMPKSGYLSYDWNVGSEDTSTTRPDRVAANVTSHLRKNRNNIVLMHDIKSHSVKAVSTIIEYGLTQGYTFASLDGNVPAYSQPVGN